MPEPQRQGSFRPMFCSAGRYAVLSAPRPAAILWLGSEVAVNRWHDSRNSEDQFISEFGMDMVLKGAFPDQDRARTLKPEWGPMDLHVLHRRSILSSFHDATHKAACPVVAVSGVFVILE